VDEAGTVHRLDRRADRLAVAIHPGDEAPQGVGIGADRGHLDRSPLLVEHVHVKPLARQVQSGVQHVVGLLVSGSVENPRSHYGGHSS